ncbi:hypothetical protein SAMN05428936_11429 [Pelagibacterium halotolerans]|nr:hypothetical protein SAMN05428936_11429 [Pelagibacterium halotolerans]
MTQPSMDREGQRKIFGFVAANEIVLYRQFGLIED